MATQHVGFLDGAAGNKEVYFFLMFYCGQFLNIYKNSQIVNDTDILSPSFNNTQVEANLVSTILYPHPR